MQGHISPFGVTVSLFHSPRLPMSVYGRAFNSNGALSGIRIRLVYWLPTRAGQSINLSHFIEWSDPCQEKNHCPFSPIILTPGSATPVTDPRAWISRSSVSLPLQPIMIELPSRRPSDPLSLSKSSFLEAPALESRPKSSMILGACPMVMSCHKLYEIQLSTRLALACPVGEKDL